MNTTPTIQSPTITTAISHEQQCLGQLKNLLKASVPIVWVLTHEEERFIRSFFVDIAGSSQYEMFTWSITKGLHKYESELDMAIFQKASGEWADSNQPPVLLNKIYNYKVPPTKKKSVFILQDFNQVMDPGVVRMLRDVYSSLTASGKTIIILSPDITHGNNRPGLPTTLEKQVTVIDYELPSAEQIEQRVKVFLQARAQAPNIAKVCKLDYTGTEITQFVTALQGLTVIEIDNALSTCLSSLKKIDTQFLLLEKKQIIKKSGILEYIGICPPIEDVGGLDLAKQYFEMYKEQFSNEAKDFGVEPLKGVVLVGIPGCGKSLLSKAIAAQWNLPLLRLDIGKVMSGLVGSSEAKMRDVIAQMEAVAPCVCWLDEIEKNLSGTGSSNFSDGGTLSRVFGTLLTAMEDQLKGVVMVATANDISALPPELIRRFNEVLFVDLPFPDERKEILNIHLRKRKRNLSKLNIDIDKVLAATNNFTGSEIEKMVKEAITRAWHDNKSEVKTEHLVGAAQDTKAIAIVMGERIEKLRDWARGRARYASSFAKEAAKPGHEKIMTKGGRQIDLGESLSDLSDIVKAKKEEQQEETASISNRKIDILD